MRTFDELPPVGTRAIVAPVDTVASRAHGQAGTITEHRFSRTVGSRGGETVAVLTFDEPIGPIPHYNVKSLGLRAHQLSPDTDQAWHLMDTPEKQATHYRDRYLVENPPARRPWHTLSTADKIKEHPERAREAIDGHAPTGSDRKLPTT